MKVWSVVMFDCVHDVRLYVVCQLRLVCTHFEHRRAQQCLKHSQTYKVLDPKLKNLHISNQYMYPFGGQCMTLMLFTAFYTNEAL